MQNQLIILGGMGPQASLKLHQLLLEQSRSLHQGKPDEYPAILHASMQVPDFISSSERTGDAVRVIRATCAQLPLENAAAIGLACNTAHLLLDDLPLERPNFVSMVEAVADELETLNAKRVGLLASPYTLRAGLFKSVLEQRGIATVQPNSNDMEGLDNIIHGVILGEDPNMLRPRLNAIAAGLEERGADALLLGCTELPVVGVESELPVVDSLSALAGAMLRKITRDRV